MQFWVLASGSKANAALVEHGGRCLLIDCGLGARALASRIEEAGRKIDEVDACLLTHTHGDHYTDASLRLLKKHNIPVWRHERHEIGADREYSGPFRPSEGFDVTPIELWHDATATHGFRVDTPSGSLGYVADTGAWTKRMAKSLAGCHVLAVEANHDVAMQRSSGRPEPLIERVLGFHGHLSNDQCSAFLEHIDKSNCRGIVLLHMSGECNTVELASSSVDRFGIPVHAARGVTGPV